MKPGAAMTRDEVFQRARVIMAVDVSRDELLEALDLSTVAIMRDNEGYDILHDGVPRTFRDRRDIAFEAARYARSKAKGEVIEILDRATGTKLVMLEDGRTG
jgi:hypothetical protein